MNKSRNLGDQHSNICCLPTDPKYILKPHATWGGGLSEARGHIKIYNQT